MPQSNREDALKAMVLNYDEWPSKDKPMPMTGQLSGYHWRKMKPNADWCLMDRNNDVISKAEFRVEYFEAIRMEHHFTQEFLDDVIRRLNKGTPSKGFNINFTRPQLVAMGHALSEYDKRKDQLHSVAVVSNRLNKVLTQ